MILYYQSKNLIQTTKTKAFNIAIKLLGILTVCTTLAHTESNATHLSDNKRIQARDILRAQSEALQGKSVDEKIKHYENLLLDNGITPKPTPYKESDYIEWRFSDRSQSKKHNLSKRYTLADQKSGAFASITLGRADIDQTYIDGLYNRTNNVPADNTDSSTCNDNDKSGCKTTGVFINRADGIKIASTLWAFGGGFGYQKFFNPYFGTRLYGDGLLSTGSEKIDNEVVGDFWYILGGMNIDLLGDIPLKPFTHSRFFEKLSIGGYVGINIGVMLLFDKANENLIKYTNNYTSKDVLWNYQLQVDYGFNAGISFSYSRYKLDIGAKVPLDKLGLPSELRLGLESPATYEREDNPDDRASLVSKDIVFKRSPIFIVSFIMLL